LSVVAENLFAPGLQRDGLKLILSEKDERYGNIRAFGEIPAEVRNFMYIGFFATSLFGFASLIYSRRFFIRKGFRISQSAEKPGLVF